MVFEKEIILIFGGTLKMKSFGVGLVSMLLIMSVIPLAGAVDIGTNLGIDMRTEEFKPLIWMCDSRTVIDDDLEPGRVNGPPVFAQKFELCEQLDRSCETTCEQKAESIYNQLCAACTRCGMCQIAPPVFDQTQSGLWCATVCTQQLYKEPCQIKKGYELEERHNNYAFEGEKIEWVVLAMDKNKIEQIQDVYVTMGPKRSGRLEDYCALAPNNVVIDGNIIESKWGDADIEVTTPAGLCDYEIFLENDCDDLYIAFNITNAPSCTPVDIAEVLRLVNAVEVNILPQASEAVVNLPQAEYRIPLSSLGVQSGDTIRLAYRMFSDTRHPSTGFLAHRLDHNWQKKRVYNEIEVECVELHGWGIPGASIRDSCNARIMEEEVDQFDPQTMAYYECTFTVEPSNSMYGEFFVSLEVEDNEGYKTINDEVEYWFFNPEIALIIEGALDFGIVRPGTLSYSDTILVGNDADPKSGVLMDMFISGTDFYDPSSQGARCVLSNRLKLGNNRVASREGSAGNVCDIGFGDTDDHLCYYATSGAYGTGRDLRSDAEGYAPIVYGDSFTRDFYNDAEIIQANPMGVYWGANILPPGAEHALTFKLGLPEPCTGDFTHGSIYFWGEAI